MKRLHTLRCLGNARGLRRDFDALEARRLKAAQLFDRNLSPSEVARRLGVHRQSACRWRQAWLRQGAKALRRTGCAGRRPKLDEVQREQVKRALGGGPQAHGHLDAWWTCAGAAEMIARLTGVRYHPDHVCRLLHQLGFICQRPVRQAIERDEPALRAWRQATSPMATEGSGDKAARSSSSMKMG